MAQANSIQREPSMEEILASIRRIIEDSDTARKDLDDAEGVAASAEPEAESQAEADMEAFRDELSDSQPEHPVSLAELQVEIERESRIEPSPLREVWPQPADFVRHPEREAAAPNASGRTDEGARESAPEPAVQAGNANLKPTILSDHTGRQVAASFGELSEAFAATRRRSFDEMAEDMMRPMLQDWLDNNLPLLVERLVREEIERVARGGAR